MQHQLQHQTPAAVSTPPSTTGEVPRKQVVLAMERLSHAARLIADIRLGADRHLEALFVAAEPHKRSRPLDLSSKEDSSLRQHLQDLPLESSWTNLGC
ncbi:hypothetical protein SLE2022_125160 [Rubroshorea leprosula]